METLYVLVLIIQTKTMVAPEYVIGPALYRTQEECVQMGERALVEIEREDPDAMGYWCVDQQTGERIRMNSGVSL